MKTVIDSGSISNIKKMILGKDKIGETDIRALITDRAEESINLDFKRAESLAKDEKRKSEIGKDVSSFANSAGGYIVYGISEKDHVAESLSFIDGNIITKEWLEQVIQSRIQRKINGLKIIPIRFDDRVDQTIYVVHIPESTLAPHMTTSKKFYKRYNFESVPMEEYEVRNLYNRKDRTELKILGVVMSRTVEYESQGEVDEQNFIKFSIQIRNVSSAIEKLYKIIVEFNFKDYVLHWDKLDPSQPNHGIGHRNNRYVSFANSSPIFPGEIASIGSMTLGFYTKNLSGIFEDGILKIRLLYSNGEDQIERRVVDLFRSLEEEE